MVREDILSSVKNAVERGSSLEQTKDSLINAGYSQKEVEQAINYLTSGLEQARQMPQINQTQNFPQRPQQNPYQNNYQIQNSQQTTYKPKDNFFLHMIILVTCLIIIVGVLIAMILSKDLIIEFFQGQQVI